MQRQKRALMKRLVTALAAGLLGLSAAAQTPSATGEVTKLDKAGGRVTLKHGEIKNLDMPPMTMAYRVRDRKMLDEVAVGDRVRFAVERIDGQYTVVMISKAP
jgi:Cu/Ag efflux protein CusF